MGIEPTRDLFEPLTGFEDQGRHQAAVHLRCIVTFYCKGLVSTSGVATATGRVLISPSVFFPVTSPNTGTDLVTVTKPPLSVISAGTLPEYGQQPPHPFSNLPSVSIRVPSCNSTEGWLAASGTKR